jgi:Phosphotransferase enzyme family
MTAALDEISATISDGMQHHLAELAAGAAGSAVRAVGATGIHGNLGAGTHLYRISSGGATERDAGRWSYVLKIFDLPGDGYMDANDDQDAWNYWRREWLVYQAPWFRGLTGVVTSAPCLASGEGSDGRLWIALADQAQYDDRPWPLERFGTVARHFGEFNGRFLDELRSPSDGWLSRGWLQGWTERSAPQFEQLTTLASNPAVARVYPPSTVDRLLEVWESRDSLYRILTELPQTFCHLDVTSANLFVVEDDHTVAIDWAFAGIANLGADLAILVSSGLMRRDIPFHQADELESLCLQKYLSGLKAIGWSGSERDVELGYLCAGVVHRGIGAIGPAIMVCLNEELHPIAERGFGYPIEKLFESAAQSADFWLQRFTRVRTLFSS